MARPGDKEVEALLSKFVCVRVVQAFGMDLSLFQFDYDLTWAVFFLNADRTIYGRYGTESPQEGPRGNTVEGLKKAAQAALEIHKGYPANKASLAGKTGPKARWKTPEAIPAFAGKARPADGTRNGCVHCHEAHDYGIRSLWLARQPIADSDLWKYPMPDVLGLSLDPNEGATVRSVAAGSGAEKAGFKPGDRIVALDGQPVVSIADVQWVLQGAPETGSLKAEVERGGRKVEISAALAAGWRRAGTFVFTGHVTGWYLQEYLVGVMGANQGSNGKLALQVQMTMGTKGDVQKGDVITGVDGKDGLTVSEYLAYIAQKKAPGQRVDLTVNRGGMPRKASWVLP